MLLGIDSGTWIGYNGVMDINRLHGLIDGTIARGRQSGLTTAACYNVAGVLGVADKPTTMLWVVPAYHWVQHITKMLINVLRLQGFEDIRVISSRKTILVGEHRIHFISATNPVRVRGLIADFVVDDLGEARKYLDEDQWIDVARDVNAALRKFCVA